MSLNRKLITIGAAVDFTKDGSAATNAGGATTTSSGVKPDNTTPADWVSLSRMSEVDVESVASEDTIMAPSPGHYGRVDILRSMLTMDMKFIGHDVNEFVFQSVFQCGAITNATPFTPLSKLGQVYGWLRLQGQSQNDNLIIEAELYGILTVKGFKADGKQVKPEFIFNVLQNALNAGTSTLASA